MGSIDTESGDFILSMRVFVPEDAGSSTIQLVLEEPFYQTPLIDLARFPRGEWSNLSIPVTRSSASGDGDRLRIIVQNRDEETTGTYYFDDFSLMPAP